MVNCFSYSFGKRSDSVSELSKGLITIKRTVLFEPRNYHWTYLGLTPHQFGDQEVNRAPYLRIGEGVRISNILFGDSFLIVSKN